MSKQVWAVVGIAVTMLLVAVMFGGDFRPNENVVALRDSLAVARRMALMAGQQTTEALEAYMAVGDTLVVVRDSVAVERARASRTARLARERGDSIHALVRATAGDSAATVTLVDSLVAARDEEVGACRREVGACDAENAILLRRGEACDALVFACTENVRAVEAENGHLRAMVAALNESAKPGILKRIERALPPLGAGILLGIVLVR